MLQPVRQKALNDAQVLIEDAQLFPSGTVEVVVDVTGQRRRMAKGELVLRGFVSNGEMELVIPASRRAAAVPLLQRLQAKVQFRKLQGNSNAARDLRERVRVNGAWRVRLLNTEDAAPDRRFQLIAARWRYRDGNGADHVFGHLPGG